MTDAPLRAFLPTDSLPQGNWIARGMGRCYGDSALGDTMLSSRQMNRLLHFEAETGILTCEAGVTYDDILQVFVPRGWFPPVTPGTKFVSMGGALASDVHGKNHHSEGSFIDHVLDFWLLLPTGERLLCSRTQHAAIFWATAGGMGLTGYILSLRLQLKRVANSYIRQRAIKVGTLSEIIELFTAHTAATYSVAWIDTLQTGKNLGRSLLLLGEHATADDLAAHPRALAQPQSLHPKKPLLTIPLDFPTFALNTWSIGAFNQLFYHKNLRQDATTLLHYNPYFYPLDAIHQWNKIYGKRGFTQYQFVVPFAAGEEAIRRVLLRCKAAGFASFLSVLKAFGAGNLSPLSFPMAGLTLTLDFPISAALFPFLDELDSIVLAYGGRVYLTKDVRIGRETLEKMYPRIDEFRALRQQLDPQQRIQSLQSRRLGL
jgi:FAD/FMN-containing dehydrogenase